ncbi:MAG: type VI secretion system tube protein Hcp [Planctomycetes bacterium]|nr:type VI secretion system tube protein Hcp [Planctomycetota bacterium]
MAEHLYLKLDGIDGSCDKDGHKKWIEIDSYSHGISYGVGSGKDFSGQVDHSPLSVSKLVDNSTHLIIQKLNRREQIKEIILEIWKDGGSGSTGKVTSAAIIIKLTNCRVSSYSMGGSDTGTLPNESISFAYQAIHWTFPGSKPTDHDFSKPFGA